MATVIFMAMTLVLDFLFADPPFLPHPVRFFGRYICWYENKTRFWEKTPKKQCFLGLFLILSLLLVLLSVFYTFMWSILKLSPLLAFMITMVLLCSCVAMRSLDKEVRKVSALLKNGEIESARKQIATLVSRDTEYMEERDMIRAAVETAAENASDGIIAPLFYMAVGGLPLALVYKAVNTMDSMVGYQNDRYQFFGYFPAKLDDVMNFIPARLTGLLLVVWAFLTGKDYRNGWRVLWKDHNKSKSPNAGWPEAAAAGILGVTLGGPTPYFGALVEKPYIGEGGKEPERVDIDKTCRLLYGVTLLFFILVCVVRGGLL